MKKGFICLILFSFFYLFGADELSIVLSESEDSPDGYLQLWLNSIYPENSESFGENSQGMNFFNEDYWVLSREFDVKLILDPNSFTVDVEDTLTDDEILEQLFELGYTLTSNCYDSNYSCESKVGKDYSHFGEITSDGSFLYTEFYFTETSLNIADYDFCVNGIITYGTPMELPLSEAEQYCHDELTEKNKKRLTLKIGNNNGVLYLSDYAKGGDVSLFYNNMDNFVYYESGACVENDAENDYIDYIDLKGFSTDLNTSPSMPATKRKVRLNFNENEDCNQDNIFQGGAFSPNGRYFIKVADTFNIDGIHDYSGLYIFEIDGVHLDPLNEKYYRDLNNSDDILNYNFVQFINFRYDGYGLDTFGEMEGIDVFPTDSRGDIHGLYIHNEGEDDSSIYHITSLKDTDSDGIKDIYDNCPYDSNQLQEDRDNNKVGDVCDDIDQDGVFDAYDNCVETHNPDQKDWNDDEIGDACQDSDNDGVLDIDDNCPSNPNSDRADYDEDGVGDVCDNCPFLSNPGQEDSEVYPSGNPNPDGVGDACDNCINRYNPVVHNPLPYQELFGAKYSGASYLALTSPFYGYFSPDRKYYIWQHDHDLDGKGDACDFENSSYTDGFFYSQITDVKGKSELPKHYPVLLTPVNRSATVKLKMPVNSGEGSPRCLYGCPVAVHYCAIDHQKKNQGFWGQDGYCSTTEKTDNPLYKNTDFSCDFGFSHGSDDFNDLAVRSWRKRISIWRESFDWLEQYAENPEDDDARHYLPMNPNSLPTEREWYWRRDWYAEKECYREENENNPLCKNLRNAGSYNEEFTMYYTL